MNVRKVIPFGVVVAIVLAACGGAAAPTTAPTSAPAATTAPQATTATEAAATTAPQATTATEATATSAPAPAGQVSNPPKSADEVDSMDLTGKNVQVLFWHRYAGAQVTKVMEIVNDFNSKNPYGITVK